MNRTKMLASWLVAACFGAVVTLGGTQILTRTNSNFGMDGGIAAAASAKTSAHITDHQHWENRRCSDHLPEGGAAGVLPADQRGVHCWTQWTEDVINVNATTGLSLLANCGFYGSAVCGSAWYVGIVGATSTFAAADTMASHSGFSECSLCYTGNRIGLSMTSAASTASSLSNAASVAAFPITATTTVYGAFLTTGSSITGTAGTLWGGASFTTARAVINGDTLNVTVTMSLT